VLTVEGVKKSQFLWLLIGVVVVAWAGWHLLGLVVAGLGLFVSYFLTVRLHPRTRHTGWRGCGGTGEHKGSIFTWRHHRCPGCQGGRLIGWGAGHLGSDHIKAEYARTKAARELAKENNRWR
jgi:hypothetical protein